MSSTISDTTLCCDRCGRPIGLKGYIFINGWIICGVCQHELNELIETNNAKNDMWERIRNH